MKDFESATRRRNAGGNHSLTLVATDWRYETTPSREENENE